jgi:serine/threonine protein kinase
MELVETYKDMNNNSFMAVGRFDDYSFPMHLLPVNQNVPVEDMKIEAVREITHFSDGSNSNIYSGKWHNEIVVVKMIKKQASFDVIALHEFDTEHEILSRIAHPNIISFLGGGNVPRRFLVLEWLGGGTLSSLINRSQSNRVAQGLFRQPTFTYAEILSRARELADAFDYLHCRVHDDLTVIHRDLKPDNVGFTATGVLKLLDMGLSTCVRRRRDSHIAYEMTGNTGSLRYMAPEVALRTAYTEKVDVYSFGILLWQMATDLVPFKGMSREEFMRDVAVGKLRPKLDGSWPVGFCNLLTTCWHHESIARPSFATVLSDLNALVEELDGGAWPKKGRSIRKRIGMAPNTDVEDPQSSWF